MREDPSFKNLMANYGLNVIDDKSDLAPHPCFEASLRQKFAKMKRKNEGDMSRHEGKNVNAVFMYIL